MSQGNSDHIPAHTLRALGMAEGQARAAGVTPEPAPTTDSGLVLPGHMQPQRRREPPSETVVAQLMRSRRETLEARNYAEQLVIKHNDLARSAQRVVNACKAMAEERVAMVAKMAELGYVWEDAPPEAEPELPPEPVPEQPAPAQPTDEGREFFSDTPVGIPLEERFELDKTAVGMQGLSREQIGRMRYVDQGVIEDGPKRFNRSQFIVEPG